MADDIEHGQEIRSDKEALKTAPVAALWLRKIAKQEADYREWEKEADEAVKVYEAHAETNTAFNIFHSNIQILVPALYNSTPIPDVRRRYNDQDPIAKQVVDLTERAVSYAIDQYDFDHVMRCTAIEAAVRGSGIARVRYEVETAPMDGYADEDGAPGEQIVSQKVGCEYVPRVRFVCGPGRTWDSMPWLAFTHDLTEDDCRDMLGLDDARLKKLGFNGPDMGQEAQDQGDTGKGILQTLRVYEIWDKREREVIWVAPEDKEQELARWEDPLELPGFWPCPRPLQFESKVGSQIPLCPYAVYRPLVKELDRVTKRIAKLVDQLKVRGLYDRALAESLELLKDAEDGEYVPASDVTQFSAGAGGGLERAIHHFPMDESIKAIAQLQLQQEQIKQQIYEVTGISDVIRGATDAAETATAQQIKSQNASLRIETMRGEVARFARDLFRLKIDVMSKHFTSQTFQQMTQLQITPEVEQVLRSDQMRAYRIDIESDSTIRADMSRHQQQMSEFLAGTAQFAQGMATAVPLMPEILPVVVEVYSSFARRFKLGKQAEDALEGLSQMAQEAKQQMEQGGKQPSEEEQKAAAEREKMNAEQQMQAEKHQADMAMAQQKHEMDMAKLAADMEAKRMEHAMKLEQMQADAQNKAIERDDQRAMRDEEFRLRQRQAGIDEQASLRKAGLSKGDDGGVIDPLAKAIESMGVAIAELAERVTDEHQTVLKAIQAPKTVSITKGRDGRVAGATVRTELN